MSISPVDIAMIQRSQDVSQIRTHELNKPMTDSMNIQQTIQKDTFVKSESVVSKDNADNNSKNPDAREKSNNEYSGDGGKRRNEARERVILKNKSGFDMKI